MRTILMIVLLVVFNQNAISASCHSQVFNSCRPAEKQRSELEQECHSLIKNIERVEAACRSSSCNKEYYLGRAKTLFYNSINRLPSSGSCYDEFALNCKQRVEWAERFFRKLKEAIDVYNEGIEALRWFKEAN